MYFIFQETKLGRNVHSKSDQHVHKWGTPDFYLNLTKKDCKWDTAEKATLHLWQWNAAKIDFVI